MKITFFLLVILSISVTFLTKNLFLSDLFLGLALVCLGVSCIKGFSTKKKLEYPKLAKVFTYGIGAILCIVGILPISNILRDQFGTKVVIETSKVQNYDKPVFHNSKKFLNIGQVYIGNSFEEYDYSNLNPDTDVLKIVHSFPDQRGPETIFRLVIAPHTGHILKAEILK